MIERWMQGRGGALLILMTMAACEGAGSTLDSEDTVGDETSGPEAELRVGAQGTQVVAVHDHLTALGYFPNAALAVENAAWKPVVAQSPADPAVFDVQTERAILAFQRHNGLIETGVVDAETRHAMVRDHCGVPHSAPRDPREKFALYDSKWPKSTLTWRVVNTDGDVDIAQVRNAASASFTIWSVLTSLTFTPITSGTADIEIKFALIDGPRREGQANIAGMAARPANGGDITIDSGDTWSVQSPPPSGAIDLQFVLTHEIGHALGLDHSSIRNAIMFPSFGSRKPPDVDDMIAISAHYDKWVQLTGAATDIGVGANNMAWAVGIDPIGDGYGIWKYNETTRNWDRADGFATRIAVAPNGVPWAVQASGAIFRRRSSQAGTVGWDQIPGCARDIGIGADGSVWVIGCEIVPGGYAIFKHNSLLSPPWERANGGGVRIAVSKTGIAWMVDRDGYIFQRNGTFAGNSGWTQREGCARDIGIHEDNYVWVAGCDAAPGGTQIYLYNQQFERRSATEGNAPGVTRWLRMDRGAVSIAVGPFARPWITRDNLVIWRSER